MTTHEEFATWDAAYVLGALSPTERRAFEAHVRECERCADSLAEFAGMPGILSRVPREQAFALVNDVVATETGDERAAEGPGPEMLPSLLHRVRRRRVRSRWLIAGLSAVAAAVVVGAAFVLPSALQPAPPAPNVAMQQVEPSALTADLRLTAEPWGTRIDSRCSYAHVGGDEEHHAWTYAMVVTDRTGAQHQISTWTADEGTTAAPVATTSVPLADIAAVDIRAGDGTVLLRSTFD